MQRRAFRISTKSPRGTVRVNISARVEVDAGTHTPREINMLKRQVADAVMNALAGVSGLSASISTMRVKDGA